MTKTHGEKTGRAVAAFFRAANMPLPRHKEYTITADKGFIVFLDNPACVLRGIKKKRMKKNKLPNLLRPLFTRDSEDLTINLYPGIRSPITLWDAMKLVARTKKDDYLFWDAKPCNAGYLPLSTEKYPHGIPVVIDQDAVKRFNIGIKSVKETLERNGLLSVDPIPSPQDDLYAYIRQKFKKAWPTECATPDPVLLNEAWHDCIDASQKTTRLHSGEQCALLTADWKNLGTSGKKKEGFKNAKHGGALYAARWNILENPATKAL